MGFNQGLSDKFFSSCSLTLNGLSQNLLNKLSQYYKFRRIMQTLHDRFPDATAADLDAANDRDCIICREAMNPATKLKKLRCGHIFHLGCLRLWLQRQLQCPTCRDSINMDDAAPANIPVAAAAAAAAARAAAQPAGGHAPEAQPLQTEVAAPPEPHVEPVAAPSISDGVSQPLNQMPTGGSGMGTTGMAAGTMAPPGTMMPPVMGMPSPMMMGAGGMPSPMMMGAGGMPSPMMMGAGGMPSPMMMGAGGMPSPMMMGASQGMTGGGVL